MFYSIIGKRVEEKPTRLQLWLDLNFFKKWIDNYGQNWIDNIMHMMKWVKKVMQIANQRPEINSHL